MVATMVSRCWTKCSSEDFIPYRKRLMPSIFSPVALGPIYKCLHFDFMPKHLITVRKWSCGKVMFSQACVKNSVHRGGGCTPPRQTPPLDRHPGQTTPWADTPLVDTPWANTPPGRHPPSIRRPLRRSVRILPECILVSYGNKQKTNR